MKIKIKKKKTLKDKIYDKIIEYRKTLITSVIFLIPIIFILYILNVHHYIFPKALGNSVIFRLDINFPETIIGSPTIRFWLIAYSIETSK